MADLAQDLFDRTDSDSLGGNWVENVGDYDISGNQALATIASRATWVGAFNPANADYDVQAIVQKTGLTGASGIMGRYVDDNNFYWLDIHTFSQSMRLFKMLAGTPTQIGTYSAGQSNDILFTIKLVMLGSLIKGFQNGVERVSVTDSDIVGIGKPGLISDSGNAWANDFLVTGTAGVAFDPNVKIRKQTLRPRIFAPGIAR